MQRAQNREILMKNKFGRLNQKKRFIAKILKDERYQMLERK